MISVVDYGLGNLGSILNMLRKLGAPAKSVSTPEEIRNSGKLIVPGVGAFDHGMDNLDRLGLIPELNAAVMDRGVPVLGICLGAQLLTRSSEEGKRPGLGWIQAETIRFFSRDPSHRLPVPHMGWTPVRVEKDSELTRDLPPVPRFYFVHSYHFQCDVAADALLTAEYGYRFVAAFSNNNVYGVQFHPEKSHKFGMKLLSNFAAINPAQPRD